MVGRMEENKDDYLAFLDKPEAISSVYHERCIFVPFPLPPFSSPIPRRCYPDGHRPHGEVRAPHPGWHPGKNPEPEGFKKDRSKVKKV